MAPSRRTFVEDIGVKATPSRVLTELSNLYEKQGDGRRELDPSSPLQVESGRVVMARRLFWSGNEFEWRRLFWPPIISDQRGQEYAAMFMDECLARGRDVCETEELQTRGGGDSR